MYIVGVIVRVCIVTIVITLLISRQSSASFQAFYECPARYNGRNVQSKSDSRDKTTRDTGGWYVRFIIM